MNFVDVQFFKGEIYRRTNKRKQKSEQEQEWEQEQVEDNENEQEQKMSGNEKRIESKTEITFENGKRIDYHYLKYASLII
jgi:hypothetical protein